LTPSTPALDAEAREIASGIETPLCLERRHRWDPDEEYWGEAGEPLEPDLQEIDGVLPWGLIDNRPFLRCLHGYGLCLWRLGRLAEAEAVFTALLWLNPGDNQGARELVEPIRSGVRWQPATRDDGDGWHSRGAGRRALLDRASAALDAPPRTPPQAEIEAAFEPLLWLASSRWAL
jgi:hypothetical protein